LDKYGENWVFRHCLQGGDSFPLASILASRSPDLSSDTNSTKIYYSSRIPEINISALAYFAASIYWRGAVYPWNDDGSIPVKLGPFQEQYRQYLLDSDLTGFPDNSTLVVMVREGKETDRITYAPTSKRMGNCHVHNFSMPGLGFTLVIGKNIPTNYRLMCIVRGSENPIFLTKVIEKPIMDATVKMLSEIAAGKGKAPIR
jgi:hypothetical protein